MILTIFLGVMAGVNATLLISAIIEWYKSDGTECPDCNWWVTCDTCSKLHDDR